MIKIKDIAKATGYSITTVSKAFNNYKDISDEAKAIILKKAEELGYVPNATARGLATKRSFMIGIIFDEILGFGVRHPFFGSVIEFFKEEVEKEGYDIIFISNRIGNSSIKSYLDHCKQRGVDGIFLACADFSDVMIQQLMDSYLPSVSVENTTNQINSVNTDDHYGLYSAVEYLYELGHKKIAHIAGSELTYAGVERRRGYLSAMADKHLEVMDGFIQDGDMYSFKGGYTAMEGFLALENRPTAITTAADMFALGAMRCIVDHGLKVPDDFSIVGYDNIDMLEFMTPSLTTVGQNVKMMGKRAAELLIQNINQKDMLKKEILINTRLIERETCRKI